MLRAEPVGGSAPSAAAELSRPAAAATSAAIPWTTRLPREAIAGVSAAVSMLPTCLSSGLLAYAPFGPELSARGAAAGLIGATAGGFFAALAARSSFIVSLPRASSALVQASLATALLVHQPFASDLPLGLVAMAACVLLAGLWQVAFGVLGVANIIKFTPHPVLAGFVNGVALLIAISGFRILFRDTGTGHGMVSALAFAGAVTLLIVSLERRALRVPAAIIGLAAGTLAFYALRALMPGVPLGPTVGTLALKVTDVLRTAADGGTYAALLAEAPKILETSLVIAVVTSLESLLVLRIARNLEPLPADGSRFLIAQGIGNAAAASLGGIALSAGPSQSIATFRAGGRTRLAGLCAAVSLFALGMFAQAILAAVPEAVLCAILFANSVAVADRWSVRVVRDALFRTKRQRTSAWKNLGVIVAVTAITAASSVTAGVFAGIALSCLIFIANMSRPLVRRRARGDVMFSRRVRPERDAELLRRSGRRRIILDLEGVMFFGNTDDLCTEIEALFGGCDMVLLDFRRVADIDVSAVGALEQAVSRSRAKQKLLLFCGLPAPHAGMFATDGENDQETTVFTDLDTALEWMEEKALREEGHSEFEELPLDQIEFLHGLQPHEIDLVNKYLMPMSFPAGTVLCHEGEEADYLWILSSGSVSVWLSGRDGQPDKRVAAVARGTTVGELSLLDRGTRSATVRADEDVTGYMIDRETFDTLQQEHPHIGAALVINIAREIAFRLRRTSQTFATEGS
jgi:SulP family sulfate permease